MKITNVKIKFRLLLILLMTMLFILMYIRVNKEVKKVFAMSNEIEVPTRYSHNKDYDIEFEIEFVNHTKEEIYRKIFDEQNQYKENIVDNKYIDDSIKNASDDHPEVQVNKVNNKNSIDFGKFKSYMSYKAITSKSSKQYKLQQKAYSDENGFRRIDDYYMIATGSYYGNVGDILLIELENGTKFYAIKSDAKDDRDTDKENKVCIHDDSVIEFIVDMNCLNKTVKKMGDASYANNFGGSIKSIEIVDKYEI